VLGADDGGETCRSVGREVRVEPEGLPDVGPHVLGLALQPREEGHQLHQLVVLLVHKPRLNGDPILQLISKGLWGVVDNDGLLEVPAQDVEVFDVVAVDADAVLSEKSELDPLPLRIQKVHQLVSVHLFAGSKEDQLKHLTDSLQELRKTRSCSHKNLVLLVLEHNGKGEVGVVELLEAAVDQGLVQVEHQRELWAAPRLERQSRMAAAHLRGQRWEVLDEEVRVKLLPMFRLGLRLGGVDLNLLVWLRLQRRRSRVDNVSSRRQGAGGREGLADWQGDWQTGRQGGSRLAA